MHQPHAIVTLALSILLAGLGGCAANRARSGADAVAPALPADIRAAVRIFDEHGQLTDWSSMRAAVTNADVIIIGESHGHPLGLEAAACLFDDILADRPDATLALEFFERDEQLAIEDYLAGVTDQAAFRKAARRTDGNYPPGHARMLEAAKASGRPVVAANAPRRYVRMTTATGYERLAPLSSLQKLNFVTPDPLIGGRYKDDFYALMGGMSHGTPDTENGIPPEMIAKMYYSQQLWDATMADSVARAAMDGGRPVVLVIGRFHSDFGGGTVQLIHRYAPSLSVLTLSMVPTDTEQFDDEDLGRADFVLYTGE